MLKDLVLLRGLVWLKGVVLLKCLILPEGAVVFKRSSVVRSSSIALLVLLEGFIVLKGLPLFGILSTVTTQRRKHIFLWSKGLNVLGQIKSLNNVICLNLEKVNIDKSQFYLPGPLQSPKLMHSWVMALSFHVKLELNTP